MAPLNIHTLIVRLLEKSNKYQRREKEEKEGTGLANYNLINKIATV